MSWKVILERLYLEGKFDEIRLNSAVVKGLITEEEKQQILNANAN